jgi:hypothetical protein
LKFADEARQAVALTGFSEYAWTSLGWLGRLFRHANISTFTTHDIRLGYGCAQWENTHPGICLFTYLIRNGVFWCVLTENPTEKEIHLNFEEAAILWWPNLLPSAFLASLERSDHNYLRGFSLVILAHFHLVNTLVDTWYMRSSFESEISKVHALIGSLNENHLSTFMLWPNEVVSLPLTCISWT